MSTERRLRIYDHRLIRLVQETGDARIATGMGVPRSTVAGWLKRAPRIITTEPGLDDASEIELRVRIAKLERRIDRLSAVLRIFFALFRLLQPDLSRLRVPHGCDKARLLRAIDRSRHVLGLCRILRIIGLSPSRLSVCRRASLACDLDDRSSCPRSSPHELTPAEVTAIRDLVTSPDYRHVPTGRLAILAQRLGRVFASPSTWYRLVRERGWRRPRLRIHPKGPRVGIRASKPDEIWHIDTTLIRLLDGTRVYLHAIIDSCGVLRNVELACPIHQGPDSLGRELHITSAASERLKPGENGGVRSPSREFGFRTADRPCLLERCPLCLKIDHCVAIRGLDAGVAEPVTDRHEIDSRPK